MHKHSFAHAARPTRARRSRRTNMRRLCRARLPTACRRAYHMPTCRPFTAPIPGPLLLRKMCFQACTSRRPRRQRASTTEPPVSPLFSLDTLFRVGNPPETGCKLATAAAESDARTRSRCASAAARHAAPRFCPSRARASRRAPRRAAGARSAPPRPSLEGAAAAAAAAGPLVARDLLQERLQRANHRLKAGPLLRVGVPALHHQLPQRLRPPRAALPAERAPICCLLAQVTPELALRLTPEHWCPRRMPPPSCSRAGAAARCLGARAERSALLQTVHGRGAAGQPRSQRDLAGTQ